MQPSPCGFNGHKGISPFMSWGKLPDESIYTDKGANLNWALFYKP